MSPDQRQITLLRLPRGEATDELAVDVDVDVECSAGTYVRALARDLGGALGSGAYLGALTRTASGPFRLDAARPLDAVREALANGRAADLLLPSDTGLDAYPRVSPPAGAPCVTAPVREKRGAAATVLFNHRPQAVRPAHA